MLAALLALGASFSWGVSNFTAGLESRRRSVWTVTSVSQIASALSAVLLSLFANGEALAAGSTAWAVIAGMRGTTGIVACYRALALDAMSVVASIIAARDLAALASVGILLTAATVLLTVAFTIGLLSIVAVLGSLSPVPTMGPAQVSCTSG